MSIFNRVIDYIDDKEIKITVYTNKLHILNYLEIVNFDEKKITIKYNKGLIVVKGKNLMISKLLNDETLIIGTIKAIEIGETND
ncbi:MAG: YabP/YqfC family sporulation protein [Bacilli bacterium]|nr:YabP/YqfC family sporulation protein [Bacilli bacterium]